jgi:hypothetical protein
LDEDVGRDGNIGEGSIKICELIDDGVVDGKYEL